MNLLDEILAFTTTVQSSRCDVDAIGGEGDVELGTLRLKQSRLEAQRPEAQLESRQLEDHGTQSWIEVTLGNSGDTAIGVDEALGSEVDAAAPRGTPDRPRRIVDVVQLTFQDGDLTLQRQDLRVVVPIAYGQKTKKRKRVGHAQVSQSKQDGLSSSAPVDIAADLRPHPRALQPLTHGFNLHRWSYRQAQFCDAVRVVEVFLHPVLLAAPGSGPRVAWYRLRGARRLRIAASLQDVRPCGCVMAERDTDLRVTRFGGVLSSVMPAPDRSSHSISRPSASGNGS